MARTLVGKMLRNYNRALNKAEHNRKVHIEDIMFDAKIEQIKAQDYNTSIQSNQREKDDDSVDSKTYVSKGKYGYDNIEDKAKENVSWMCDKCMNINFGNQKFCSACGDVLDEEDERL